MSERRLPQENAPSPLEEQHLNALDDPLWKAQIAGLKTVTKILNTAFELDAQLEQLKERDRAAEAPRAPNDGW